MPTSVQNKLAAGSKSKGTLYAAKTNVSLRPQRKTVKRKISTEMAGDRNSPLGLLLEKEDDDD